jgi:hypothetical protein
LKQTIDHLVHDGIATDVMVIVQHKDKRLVDRLEDFVDQKIRSAFWKTEHILIRLAQIWKDRLAEFGIEVSDPVCDVTEEDYRVCVGVIELVPDRWPRLVADKIGDERGFAATGISGDERDERSEIRV